jgi:hypothetical protein
VSAPAHHAAVIAAPRAGRQRDCAHVWVAARRGEAVQPRGPRAAAGACTCSCAAAHATATGSAHRFVLCCMSRACTRLHTHTPRTPLVTPRHPRPQARTRTRTHLRTRRTYARRTSSTLRPARLSLAAAGTTSPTRARCSTRHSSRRRCTLRTSACARVAAVVSRWAVACCAPVACGRPASGAQQLVVTGLVSPGR